MLPIHLNGIHSFRRNVSHENVRQGSIYIHTSLETKVSLLLLIYLNDIVIQKKSVLKANRGVETASMPFHHMSRENFQIQKA